MGTVARVRPLALARSPSTYTLSLVPLCTTATARQVESHTTTPLERSPPVALTSKTPVGAATPTEKLPASRPGAPNETMLAKLALPTAGGAHLSQNATDRASLPVGRYDTVLDVR